MESVNIIIFWLLLLDSLIVNYLAWFGNKWYVENFRSVSRYLPMAKGWAALYLLLVIYIGFLVY